MPRLAPAELRSRLAFDYRTLAGLSREATGKIEAYASISGIGRQSRLSAEAGEDGLATAYLVEYRFTHLIGRGRTHASATAVFDLQSGGNYPFTSPGAAFISRPVPWTPHVHPASGIICLGDGWANAAGHMLLGQLVVHVMRLMNFDEPRTWADAHWNASADAYWHAELGRRPFLPDLRYPRLPVEITHGIPDASTAFRGVRDEPESDRMFRHAGGKP